MVPQITLGKGLCVKLELSEANRREGFGYSSTALIVMVMIQTVNYQSLACTHTWF